MCVLIQLWKQHNVEACVQTGGACAPGKKKKKLFRLDSDRSGLSWCKQCGWLSEKCPILLALFVSGQFLMTYGVTDCGSGWRERKRRRPLLGVCIAVVDK